MSEAIGFLAKLGISANSPVDAQFEFLPGTNIGKTAIVLPNQGFRGVLDEHGSRTRNGEYTVSGRLEMEPGAAELALLLPWILGTPASGTTYAPGDNPPSRYITMDKVTKVFTYAGCKVSEAIFSAQQGNDTALKLSIGVEGLTETKANAGTFPDLSISQYPYFTFNQDASLTVNSNAVQAARVEFAIRYTMHMRNLNSSSRTLVRPVRRQIGVSLWLPYDDAAAYEALYDAGAPGVPVVCTFNNSGHGTSLVFTFANVQFPAQPQEIDMNGEIMLRLDGIARRTGTDNNALICTLDNTP